MNQYHPACIDNRNFNDYASALKHYESVKPVRGDADNRRPIGRNRRYKYMEVTRPNELTVGAVLYETTCIEYSEDGFITLNIGNWNTLCTVRFMDAVLPPKFGTIFFSKHRVIFRLRNGDEYHIEKNTPFKLKAVIEDGNWVSVEPVNTPVYYEYRLNRKKMTQIREKFKPFLDYMDVTAKLSNLYTSDELIEMSPSIYDKVIARVEETSMGVDRDKWMLEHEVKWRLRNCLYQNVAEVAIETNHLHGDNYTRYKREVAWSLVRGVNIAAGDDVSKWRLLTIGLSLLDNGWNTTESTGGRFTFFDGIDARMVWMADPTRMKDRFERMLKVVYADLLFDKREVKQGTLAGTTNLHLMSVYHNIKDYLTARQNVQL